MIRTNSLRSCGQRHICRPVRNVPKVAIDGGGCYSILLGPVSFPLSGSMLPVDRGSRRGRLLWAPVRRSGSCNAPHCAAHRAELGRAPAQGAGGLQRRAHPRPSLVCTTALPTHVRGLTPGLPPFHHPQVLLRGSPALPGPPMRGQVRDKRLANLVERQGRYRPRWIPHPVGSQRASLVAGACTHRYPLL